MFAQVDTKTVYTFMESMITIERYVQTAKAMGYRQLGVMDRHNLYGAYHFIEACRKETIQPLVGCEVSLVLDERSYTLYLLALTTVGYRNLMKVATAQMTGDLDVEGLVYHSEGILVIVPYVEGLAADLLPLDYAIGVYPDTPAFETDRPLFPLYTVRMFEAEEGEALQVLQAIRENTLLNQVAFPSRQQILLEPARVESMFAEKFPQALAYMEEVVGQVSYQLDTRMKLPRFNPQRPAVEELREKAQQGLIERGVTGAPYQERLDRELAVIHQMGFDDYFLIVWDLLRFGRSQGYYMGMGRGSAVGSLVAYALQITGIDPVKHQLLFERFLNEERYSMPDIDIDIPDIHRPDFMRYVRDRYGRSHAAQIVTFSTFGAKQAIRDVFKRFGTPDYELSHLTKPISFRDNLASAYEKHAAFRQKINSRPEYQRAFAIARQIEGQPRQTSIHAAGVVMSDEDLTDTIPLKAGEDLFLTQYDASAVEANGLLKMDFLGLRNLTLVQKMAEEVQRRYQKTIDIGNIDLEDPQTLALFASGQTKGIFQFEQAGAIHLLRRVQPTVFEDIVATTSLNRPGASDYADNFVRRKQGKEAIDLLDPSIAAILEPTYGIMLYQEQVMQIAQVYAGFSLGRADLLRRAMSKKNAEEMLAMERDFLEGARVLGHSQEQAQYIFARMAKFAGYGFNRSHAYAYSALAFQMAYFKCHYPAVFFEILLNYSSSDYVGDALHQDFCLAPLRIQTIPYKDHLESGQITLGLSRIKGLPRELAFWILEARKERAFVSVEDFILRLPKVFHKKESLLPLVYAGVFDDFESNRRKICDNLDHLFIFAEAFGSFFAEESYSWQEADDFSLAEKYALEQEVVGVGVSPHPLLKQKEEGRISYTEVTDLQPETTATVLVQVVSIRVIRTKKAGEKMAFLQVSDPLHRLDVTVFPETYQQLGVYLEEGGLYYLTGKVQERDGRLQLVLQQLEPATTERFWMLLANRQADRQVAAILKQYPGNIPVLLHYQDSNQTVQIKQLFVKKDPELQAALAEWSMKTVFR